MVQVPQSSLQKVSKFDWWLWSRDTRVPCVMWDVSNAGLNKEKNLFCALIITRKNSLTRSLTEHYVPWQVLSALANWPEDSFSTQMSVRDVDSGYPPGDYNSALSYCDTPSSAWSIEGCVLHPPAQAVCSSREHVAHTPAFGCAIPPGSAMLLLFYDRALHNAIQKAGVWQSLPLHWHACPKLSSTAVCSHSLDRQLPPLWLLCVILGISKWNYPSDILYFKSSIASFPVKTSEWFFSCWERLFAIELGSKADFFHTYWNLIKRLFVFHLPKSLLFLLIYGTRFSKVHPYLCTIVVC